MMHVMLVLAAESPHPGRWQFLNQKCHVYDLNPDSAAVQCKCDLASILCLGRLPQRQLCQSYYLHTGFFTN